MLEGDLAVALRDNSIMTSKGPTSSAVPGSGRSCGACSLCCKLAKVVELDRPDGVAR
jgi:hypothetical protein